MVKMQKAFSVLCYEIFVVSMIAKGNLDFDLAKIDKLIILYYILVKSGLKVKTNHNDLFFQKGKKLRYLYRKCLEHFFHFRFCSNLVISSRTG